MSTSVRLEIKARIVSKVVDRVYARNHHEVFRRVGNTVWCGVGEEVAWIKEMISDKAEDKLRRNYERTV